MILAVDKVIPYWQEAFGEFGELRPYAAAGLTPDQVADADVLIVRTVTRVGPELLDGSRVRLVAAASVGLDNFDEPYLGARGIAYTNAAGCNANAVAEYVAAALLDLAGRRGWRLEGRSLAIIGVGHVGTEVEGKARALGMTVLRCDPPLAEATGDPSYRPLAEVLGADVITLHVPLTRTGAHPTWHLLDREVLRRLTREQVIVNAARGGVVDSQALLEALEEGRLGGAVLDVWEGEPRIRQDLLRRADLGTPHVAGYSIDAKVRCTAMIADAVARHAGRPPTWRSDSRLPGARPIALGRPASPQAAAAAAVATAYDIRRDDARLREVARLGPEAAASGFSRLRNEYAFRPEFRHHRVSTAGLPPGAAQVLSGLGFTLAAEP